MEKFLEKKIDKMGEGEKVVDIGDEKGLKKIKLREGGKLEEKDNGNGGRNEEENEENG